MSGKPDWDDFDRRTALIAAAKNDDDTLAVRESILSLALDPMFFAPDTADAEFVVRMATVIERHIYGDYAPPPEVGRWTPGNIRFLCVKKARELLEIRRCTAVELVPPPVSMQELLRAAELFERYFFQSGSGEPDAAPEQSHD